ncbi:MAG: phage major capsid protein [Burkholderiaceae bacterium]|nr:phage major capsid protein [Burkholderiaceae bacterium]
MKKSRIVGVLLFAAATMLFGPAFVVDPSLANSLFRHLGGADVLGAAGMGAMALGAMGETTILDIKSLIEKQGQAWEEHKKTNDDLIKAKADGKAVADLEAKLAKIGADMDNISELKAQFEEIMTKLNRPGAGGKADETAAAEIKGFNAMIRADFQSKGKPIPAELNADQYAQYKSAFFKLAAGVTIDSLSGDERKALSAGSDPDGGYMLPQSTVGRMVTKIFEQSTMRQLANVQTISTDKLEGMVDNNEADAGWVSEIGTRSDTGTPQVGKYEIQAHEMYAMPKISQKLIDDAATDVEGWLASKVSDKFARVEGAGFTTGNGVGKPRGLFAYDTAATSDDTRAWGMFEHIKTGANGAFHTTKADPLQELIGAFKDQHLQNAQFLMRREMRTAIRKMKEATSDRYLWEPSLQAGQPDRLLGYVARIDQYVPAMATDSLSLAFGDFKEAYTIVDRIGVRTLRDPFTAKPYVVFYSTKRTGGGAVNFEAVKFLKLAA